MILRTTRGRATDGSLDPVPAAWAWNAELAAHLRQHDVRNTATLDDNSRRLGPDLAIQRLTSMMRFRSRLWRTSISGLAIAFGAASCETRSGPFSRPSPLSPRLRLERFAVAEPSASRSAVRLRFDHRPVPTTIAVGYRRRHEGHRSERLQGNGARRTESSSGRAHQGSASGSPSLDDDRVQGWRPSIVPVGMRTRGSRYDRAAQSKVGHGGDCRRSSVACDAGLAETYGERSAAVRERVAGRSDRPRGAAAARSRQGLTEFIRRHLRRRHRVRMM